MHLKFSGRGLVYLSHYMAKDDIRYYLKGIYLAPLPGGHGVIGAATNGHILGMWRDPDGRIDRPVIARVTKGLVNALKKSDTHLENIDGRLACVQYKPDNGVGFELYVQPNDKPIGFMPKSSGIQPWEVEGKFPVIAKAVPKASDTQIGMEATVNAAYLGTIAASLPGTNRWGNGVTMRQTHKGGGILVLCHTVPEAVAVIMPMRGDPRPESHWLDGWLHHAARAGEVAAMPVPGRQPSDAAPPSDYVPIRHRRTL